jgi:hypothetical protein
MACRLAKRLESGGGEDVRAKAIALSRHHGAVFCLNDPAQMFGPPERAAQELSGPRLSVHGTSLHERITGLFKPRTLSGEDKAAVVAVPLVSQSVKSAEKDAMGQAARQL